MKEENQITILRFSSSSSLQETLALTKNVFKCFVFFSQLSNLTIFFFLCLNEKIMPITCEACSKFYYDNNSTMLSVIKMEILSFLSCFSCNDRSWIYHEIVWMDLTRSWLQNCWISRTFDLSRIKSFVTCVTWERCWIESIWYEEIFSWLINFLSLITALSLSRTCRWNGNICRNAIFPRIYGENPSIGWWKITWSSATRTISKRVMMLRAFLIESFTRVNSI